MLITPSRLILLAPCALAAFSISCTQPGYRNEVYPGQQGQYVIKQVPITPSTPTPPSDATPPQLAQQTSVTSNGATPPPSESSASTATGSNSDDTLATITSLWPRLSKSDRAAVVDMAHHLASPPSP